MIRRTIFTLVLTAAAGAIFRAIWPDVDRYRKMREM